MTSRRNHIDTSHPGAKPAAEPVRASEAGTSLLELILVLGMLGVLTAISLALLLQSYASVKSRLGTTTDFDTGATAVNQMAREIRMAGYPSSKCFSAPAVAASPGLVATPFVTVTPYDLMFQADVNGDGMVEQIEYVNPPQSVNLYRRITVKNLSGSLAAGAATTLVMNGLQNQANNQPLFTWDVDPSIPQAFPLNVRTVYINLLVPSTGSPASSTAMTLMATCPRMNF